MSMGRRIFALFLLLACAACQSRAPTVHAPPPTAPPALPDDGMVDIGGGAALHVHGVGEGSPMVLIDEPLPKRPIASSPPRGRWCRRREAASL